MKAYYKSRFVNFSFVLIALIARTDSHLSIFGPLGSSLFKTTLIDFSLDSPLFLLRVAFWNCFNRHRASLGESTFVMQITKILPESNCSKESISTMASLFLFGSSDYGSIWDRFSLTVLDPSFTHVIFPSISAALSPDSYFHHVSFLPADRMFCSYTKCLLPSSSQSVHPFLLSW